MIEGERLRLSAKRSDVRVSMGDVARDVGTTGQGKGQEASSAKKMSAFWGHEMLEKF